MLSISYLSRNYSFYLNFLRYDKEAFLLKLLVNEMLFATVLAELCLERDRFPVGTLDLGRATPLWILTFSFDSWEVTAF